MRGPLATAAGPQPREGWIRLVELVYRAAACGDTGGLPSGWGADACTIPFALTRTPIVHCLRVCGPSV